jgi:hypothetical protein
MTASPTPPANFQSLPVEVLEHIFSYAGPFHVPATIPFPDRYGSFFSLRSTCKLFREVVNGMPFWLEDFDLTELIVSDINRHPNIDGWYARSHRGDFLQILLSDPEVVERLAGRRTWRFSCLESVIAAKYGVPSFGKNTTTISLDFSIGLIASPSGTAQALCELKNHCIALTRLHIAKLEGHLHLPLISGACPLLKEICLHNPNVRFQPTAYLTGWLGPHHRDLPDLEFLDIMDPNAKTYFYFYIPFASRKSLKKLSIICDWLPPSARLRSKQVRDLFFLQNLKALYLHPANLSAIYRLSAANIFLDEFRVQFDVQTKTNEVEQFFSSKSLRRLKRLRFSIRTNPDKWLDFIPALTRHLRFLQTLHIQLPTPISESSGFDFSPLVGLKELHLFMYVGNAQDINAETCGRVASRVEAMFANFEEKPRVVVREDKLSPRWGGSFNYPGPDV